MARVLPWAVLLSARCWQGAAAVGLESELDNVIDSVERSASVWELLLYVAGLLLCFVALAVVCDEYLAPALEKLVDTFKVPHDVASATFLAFGSSAPEISINFVATLHGKVEMSLGAVLGSGIIAYTVIPASCVLVSENQVLRLEFIPLVRDVAAYTLAIVLFVSFSLSGSFSQGEDTTLVVLFFVYLVILYYLGRFYHSVEDSSQVHCTKSNDIVHGENTLLVANRTIDAIEEFANERKHKMIPKKYNTIGGDADSSGHEKTTRDPVVVENREEVRAAENWFTKVINAVSNPFRAIFRATILPCGPGEPEGGDDDGKEGSDDQDDEIELGKWWPWAMVMSLLYVCLLSNGVLVLTGWFAESVGLPDHIAGLTILALGAQVPDLFASVAVARKGEGPSSIANALGSQIINILFGVGAPFLAYNLHTGSPILVDVRSSGGSSGGLSAMGAMLCFLVLVFVVLCFRHVHRRSGIPALRQPCLNSLDAVVLLALYSVSLVILVVAELR